jgi:hypothetical protein
MKTVAANSVGVARRETLAGRDYLVVPMTMLVPGVLNGSKGALLYPSDEVQKRPWMWNGMPLVGRHPVSEAGQALSAREPSIIEKQGLGTVYRAQAASGPLQAEAWFDVDRTAAFDRTLPAHNQILPRLQAGLPVEISTGLFTNDLPAQAGAVFNGVPYAFTATDYIPDHLAVLPDEVGACSIKHGCGVLVTNVTADTITPELLRQLKEGQGWSRQIVNGKSTWVFTSAATTTATTPTLPTENQMKKTLIAWLTTNCQCWKGEQAYLEQKSEEQLKSYKTNAVAAKLALAAKSGLTVNRLLTRNAEGGEDTAAPAGVSIADLAEFFGVAVDPANDPIGFTKELTAKMEEVLAKLKGDAPAATETPAEPTATEPAPTGNQRKPQPTGPLTEQQWLSQMPAAFRPVWNNAVNLDKQARQQLVDRIVTHNSVGNTQLVPQLQALYGKMALPELQMLAAALPSQQAVQHPIGYVPSYAGANVPLPVGNSGGQAGDNLDDDILPLPTMNWGREAS